MNIIYKISMLFLAIISCMLLSSCKKEQDECKTKYTMVPYSEGKLFTEDAQGVNLGAWIVVVNSEDELSNYSLQNIEYEGPFFENRALIIVQFQYTSSEKNISFSALLRSEQKLYFIFEMDGRKRGELSTQDIIVNLYSIEVEKSILKDMDLGDILVINRRDITNGSYFYSNFNGIILE